tara:strand:+ start:1811 stop:2362 length:552 start_codon:yes stop_codon:yes gene_type:complete
MINTLTINLLKIILTSVSIFIASSCSNISTETKRTDINDVIYMPHQRTERELAEAGGGSFLRDLFGNSKSNSNTREIQISVNPYLWQASLEILSSTMPLASVDSNSGIIITDWYNLKSNNNERVKISILIDTQELRADGVKVSIFKQIRSANTWNAAKVNPKIVASLERKIIRQAGLLANTSN